MRQSYDVWVMRLMLVVVLADYVAQIPYYLDLYYLPHGALPSLPGTLALTVTLAWFLAGYVLLQRGSRVGYWVLLAFLAVEFAFYLWNNASQLAHGFQPFFHLHDRDPILAAVFAVGYLNFLTGACFIVYLLVRRSSLLGDGVRAAASAAAGERATRAVR